MPDRARLLSTALFGALVFGSVACAGSPHLVAADGTEHRRTRLSNLVGQMLANIGNEAGGDLDRDGDGCAAAPRPLPPCGHVERFLFFY